MAGWGGVQKVLSRANIHITSWVQNLTFLKQVSTAAIVAKATQEPQLPWFFTGETKPENLIAFTDCKVLENFEYDSRKLGQNNWKENNLFAQILYTQYWLE